MNKHRQVVFETNQKVRDGVQGHRHPTFAEHMLRIPEQDYYALLKIFPNLNNNQQPMAREDEWKRFMASDYSLPYRVYKTHKGIRKNGLIIPHVHSLKET